MNSMLCGYESVGRVRYALFFEEFGYLVREFFIRGAVLHLLTPASISSLPIYNKIEVVCDLVAHLLKSTSEITYRDVHLISYSEDTCHLRELVA